MFPRLSQFSRGEGLCDAIHSWESTRECFVVDAHNVAMNDLMVELVLLLEIWAFQRTWDPWLMAVTGGHKGLQLLLGPPGIGNAQLESASKTGPCKIDGVPFISLKQH